MPSERSDDWIAWYHLSNVVGCFKSDLLPTDFERYNSSDRVLRWHHRLRNSTACNHEGDYPEVWTAKVRHE